MNRELQQQIHDHGVVGRRQNRELAGPIDVALRNGELVAVLCGVYVTPDTRDNPEVLLRAVAAWDPNAVVTGAAAAAASFWPRIAVAKVDVVTARARARPGFLLHRWLLPAEHVVERAGIRLTSPALTALLLCGGYGGEAINGALRSRMVSIEGRRLRGHTGTPR